MDQERHEDATTTPYPMTQEHRELLEFIHDLQQCGLSLTQLMTYGVLDSGCATKEDEEDSVEAEDCVK